MDTNTKEQAQARYERRTARNKHNAPRPEREEFRTIVIKRRAARDKADQQEMRQYR